MPDLNYSLSKQDLGYLRIVADLWEIGIDFKDPDQGRIKLIFELSQVNNLEKILGNFSQEALLAIEDLIENDGRILWAQFVRQYGPLRKMGPGRRDRERPYLNPQSITEILWYRAIIARDFFEHTTGLDEFAYIPDELLAILSSVDEEKNDVVKKVLGRSAIKKEYSSVLLTNENLLENACTLLAALRSGLPKDMLCEHWNPLDSGPYPIPVEFVKKLLRAAGAIDQEDQILIERTRELLEMPREEAQLLLYKAWEESTELNDLLDIPGLAAEGEWANDPLLARSIILSFLKSIPPQVWWSMSALIEAIKLEFPDFQRPAGDYDSWYLRNIDTGEYLRGFEHWDEVDGALIKYIVAGPLYWLGLTDLASVNVDALDKPDGIASFRITRCGHEFMHNQHVEVSSSENESLIVRSDGLIATPPLTPRVVRYQVARFCDWEPLKGKGFLYRITPGSLERARDQGLKVKHVLAVLHNNSRAVPPSLVNALVRWQENGIEASFMQVTVLRVSHPEIIQSLKRTRAKRYLGNSLGPTVIVIKPGGVNKVQSALAELGFLGEVKIE